MAENSGSDQSRRTSRAFSVRDSRQLEIASRRHAESFLAASASSSIADPTSLESFVRTLQWSRLYGPISLIDSPQKIGQGGQFYVYKQEAGFPYPDKFRSFVAAVKRPMFPERQEKIDLANEDLRTNIHHAHLEIKALTHERLRDHPNIVKLLAWSVDYTNWRSPLGLVFELASSDLSKFLQQEERGGISCLTKSLLGEDVARGLDVIHESGFVHGDLKPENVLLFWENDRHVGKLSDFGFATGEGDHNVGGTAAWQPPERVSSQEGDRFTYGLFLWRIFMHAGTAPQPFSGKVIQELVLEDLANNFAALGEPISGTLRKAFEKLLKEDPKDRPPRLTGLLQDAIPQPECGPTSTLDPEEPVAHMIRFAAPLFSWDVPAISRFLMRSLYDRFVKSRKQVPQLRASDLLAMALAFSVRPPEQSKSGECVLSLLEAAARGGSRPAEALIPRATAFYAQPLPQKILQECLMTGVCTGSTYARLDLESRNKEALNSSMKKFHEQGGYVLMYWDLPSPPPKPTVPPCPQQQMICYNTFHWLAAFGDLEALESHLQTEPVAEINDMTAKQETPLYLACVRGSWAHVEVLLRYGADANVRCTPFGISCLHWIFSFHPDLQRQAVQGLVEAGADIDALLAAELPFFHYPFKLPAGSPLHWAVATGSHCAIRALIEQGADPLVRNGSDPYMYDDRIRWLYAVGGPDEEAKTFPEPGCQGLSPLDLAAIQRDGCVFQAVQDFGCNVNVNASDEEGFTVLHRLSHEQLFRTSTLVIFSPFPFRTGTDSADLMNVVSLVKQLGGDIESLTSSAIPEAIKQQRKPWEVPSYTPLMLAMLQSDLELMSALITCGADVHTQNVFEETALLSLSHRAAFQEKPCLEGVQLLVTHGANVNHHSSDGSCALVRAAAFMMLDVFEFLLHKGADVDARKPGQSSKNLNVFGILARRQAFPRYEEIVLRLLKEYLFSCADEEKRRRVTYVGDDSGVTLLHQFATATMPSCVEALLQNGAPVNAPSSQFQKIYPTGPDGQENKRVWKETPLDAVKKAAQFRERHMHNFKSDSAQDFRVIQENTDKIIALLTNYGGISLCDDIRIEPVQES